MANTSYGEAGVFLAQIEKANIHFLECTTKLYKKLFFPLDPNKIGSLKEQKDLPWM